VDIIGVPLDLGVRELGLKLGPDAFREAGLVQVTSHLGLDARDRGDVPVVMPPSSRNDRRVGAIAATCRDVARAVRESLKAGRVPVCLGGDHSVAIGSLAGVAAALGRVGCLWLDAHPDANTPETSPSGNIHGMPVAVILGHGPEELVRIEPRGAKVRYEDMVLLGARDADPGELEFIRQHDVRMFTVFDIVEEGLAAVTREAIRRVSAQTRGVHVSIDLDVLCEDIAPGVGLPSRCGFNMREATYICRRIAAECPVSSVDVVGLNPVRDRDETTVRCAIEILMALLGYDFSFSYDEYLRDQLR